MGVNNLDCYALFVGDLVQMTKLGTKGAMVSSYRWM
jgi:hypothetical protein